MVRERSACLLSLVVFSLVSFTVPADPSEHWTTVGDRCYLFQDCTNVYALVDGERACLIGFASGQVMDHLQEIGVKQVDLILVTHHHRDGLQGIQRAVSAGIPIVIPANEAPFIEAAGQHWATKRIFNNYEGASRFNAITFDIPVGRRVREGDVIQWGRQAIEVVETPGHTAGSVTYFVPRGGKRLAFTGDFYAAPGRTLTMHDLHWGYMPGEFTEALQSAEKLLTSTPLLICPEHGRPFVDDGSGLERLRSNLQNLGRIVKPNNKRPAERKPGQAVGPHLVFVGEPVTYAILSDSRHAIIVDPGYLRSEDLDAFRKKYQIQSVDAVTFSHYHDDHLARTLEMIHTRQGTNGPINTKIWVFHEMADVLAHPERYNIPCLFPIKIDPDRVIRDGEVVTWEGLELTFRHFPGQTWYHTVILLRADGHSYALTGDSVWGPRDRSIPINGPVIPRNRYFLDKGFQRVFQILLDAGVDTIAPSHYDPFEVTRADLEKSLAWAKSIEPAVAALVEQPHPAYGIDPHWAHFYPYRVSVEPSVAPAVAKVSLMVQNYLDREVPLEVTLMLPEGISADRIKGGVALPAGRATPVDFVLKILPDRNRQRRVVLADIVFDGRYVGQVAEMVIDTSIDVAEYGLK